MILKQFILKIKLLGNSTLLLSKWYLKLLLITKYSKLVKEINEKYHKQGNMIPLNDMKKAIINTYYKPEFTKRLFLIEVIQNVMIVKNIFPIKKVKKQSRNELCNCGSKKKYKKCCLKKEMSNY